MIDRTRQVSFDAAISNIETLKIDVDNSNSNSFDNCIEDNNGQRQSFEVVVVGMMLRYT